LPRQLLELRVGVDDALATLHLRDEDRDRHLVEEAPELLAFERARQARGGEESLDLLGLRVVLGHASWFDPLVHSGLAWTDANPPGTRGTLVPGVGRR
jgi:hypothetical protein